MTIPRQTLRRSSEILGRVPGTQATSSALNQGLVRRASTTVLTPTAIAPKALPSRWSTIVVSKGTGGLSAGIAVALLTPRDPAQPLAQKLVLLSRQDPARMNKDGLRVDAPGPDGKARQTVLLRPADYPQLSWGHDRDLPDMPRDALVIDGGSALHLEPAMKQLLKGESKADVITVANGLAHKERLESMRSPEGEPAGFKVHPGIAWFNGKDHPDPATPGKFVSSGGSFAVTFHDRELRSFFESVWNSNIVKLDSKAPAEGRVAEYRKAAANAGLNPLGIIFGVKLRAMLQIPGVHDMMRAICRECHDVARANGVDIGTPEELFQAACDLVDKATRDKDFHTSSYAPFAKGETTELEFINGQFSRLAGKAGVQAPLNTALNDIIKDMTAQRMARTEEGLPRYATDEQFRADPAQQLRQNRALAQLMQLASIKLGEPPGK